MSQSSSPPTTYDQFGQGPTHNADGVPPSTPPSSPPPDMPYPGATASSFELELGSMDDADVDFSGSPSAMDRIRRGISNKYSTVTGRRQNFDDEDAFRHARKSSLLASETSPPPELSTARETFLTSVDLDTIQKLDADYERALLQREIGWNARYISVRQNAGLSLWFFFVFLMCGSIFFQITTDWTLGESLLFSMYTITTVGYGNHIIPNKPSVLIFICFYIFIGIAMLTILVAQMYQWLVLEITWAQYERDSKKFIKKHKQTVKNAEDLDATMVGEMPIRVESEEEMIISAGDKIFDVGLKFLNWVQSYIKNNAAGQLIAVLVPFSILIALGAIVVGSIQGWDLHESIYFAVVSMTTVGFGDYYPSKLASTWFCIFWLPFSVGFLSLYLGSIAHLYIDISGRNVKRIEKKLRLRIKQVKEAEEQERAAAMARVTSGGFDLEEDEAGPFPAQDGPNHLSHLGSKNQYRKPKGFASLSPTVFLVYDSREDYDDGSLGERRENILVNSKGQKRGDEKMLGETMKSMRDVISAVQHNMATPRRFKDLGSPAVATAKSDPYLSLKSTRHYNTAHGVEKKPSFALRVLIQERFSEIIAHEIAGYQSHVEIKNNTLSVTIDSLKLTADKWQVPRRARKSFRSVAFEVLYFVGERALIVRGADAVFDLTPHEVQGLFAPLLAAFGDADTMEAWLMKTQTIAENELNEEVQKENRQIKFHQVEEHRENKITHNMTATPNIKRNVIGNAVTNQS